MLRKLTRSSEPQASIDANAYTLHYMVDSDVAFLCICERSYPRKLAFTYLADLAREFLTTHPPQQVHAPGLRPYAFMDFDTFIAKTKSTYADARASQNLDKLNDELRDVTKVMTKNIEDLLYRGDSLEQMGEISSRLRDDSKKYRRAAVRINWEASAEAVRSVCRVGLHHSDVLVLAVVLSKACINQEAESGLFTGYWSGAAVQDILPHVS